MLDNLQQFLTGLADNYRANEIDKREIEHRILEAIADEIDNNSLDRATWLKAFSEAEADDAKAKALYIKYRKERLLDQLDAIHIQLKRENGRRQQQAKEAQRQNAAAERSNLKPAESSAPTRRKTPEEQAAHDRTTGAWVLLWIAVSLAALALGALLTYRPTSVEASASETQVADTSTTITLPKITDDLENYRTQIEEGYFGEPEILDSLVLIRASCGTGCSVNFIADQTTGDIYRLELGGEDMQSLQFLTNNTNYVTAQWEDWEKGICQRQGFEWKDFSLEPTAFGIQFDLSEYDGDCPSFETLP